MTITAAALRETADRPIDDPLPEGLPVIDEPGREIPVVDPQPPQAPRPLREPQSDPTTPRPADA